MEGKGSSEKPWGGSGGKHWAPVAHRAPPRTGAEGAANKMDGAIGVMAVAHREDAPPPTRAEIATKKVDGAMEVMAVAHRVAPAPQGVAKKMDGATGVLAVAQPEAPPPRPLRGEDAAKKRERAIEGRVVKKGPDEAAAGAFQGGTKPDNKGKGKKVAAGTKQPSAPAETATVSSPGGTPEEKKKGKGKASGDEETAPVTSGAPRVPSEAASASSSRGRVKPANHRNRRKGGVCRRAETAAPGETADGSPPCVVEPQNKSSGGRPAGAAPSSDSSDRKSFQPVPTSKSSGGKNAQPAPIGNSLDRKSAQPAPIGNSLAQPSPADELSSNRRTGGALRTTGETKPELSGEKPPMVEAKSTARAVRVVVRSARPPSIRGPRQQHGGGQHGGVWVPKVVAPAPSRHSESVRKNN
ncbi:hypothetical protein E2562_020252 [Oryza meyeriana var. granulata]|uniref:Uncharacterized protein n=1 Tax=Oryza meyeriana var. granulata TaxID=110450 RepID=A0A6G1DN27_9ORYZ|nr:hypothetical protein E2562_020252 [Oryza meyeriana var. granulata]